MRVKLLKQLCVTDTYIQTQAPWLTQHTLKVKLDKIFVIEVADKNSLNTIVVPWGYVSDGSSIPRFLWWLIRPYTEELKEAIIIHDYFYSHLHWHYSRRYADRIFCTMLKSGEFSTLTRYLIYTAVRIWGKGGWYRRTLPGAHPHWSKRYAKVIDDVSGTVPA